MAVTNFKCINNCLLLFNRSIQAAKLKKFNGKDWKNVVFCMSRSPSFNLRVMIS